MFQVMLQIHTGLCQLPIESDHAIVASHMQ